MYYPILSLYYLKQKNGSCIQKYRSRKCSYGGTMLLLVLIIYIIFFRRLGNVEGMVCHPLQIH